MIFTAEAFIVGMVSRFSSEAVASVVVVVVVVVLSVADSLVAPAVVIS